MNDVVTAVLQIAFMAALGSLAGVGLVTLLPWYRRKQEDIYRMKMATGWYHGHRDSQRGQWVNPYEDQVTRERQQRMSGL
jgi:hypothetical protein